MSVKSKSIQKKSKDERLRKVSNLKVLLKRPELGALGGSVIVFIFFVFESMMDEEPIFTTIFLYLFIIITCTFFK